jgi:ferritin-like protein
MSSEGYHEPIDRISARTQEMHRGIVSLIEEWEAIDWYQQRADACTDAELRAIILHNRDEEIEHAMMNLEWLRRHSPEIDARARIYLFSEGPILEVEARAEGKAPPAGPKVATPGPVAPAGGTLGIGSLRRR